MTLSAIHSVIRRGFFLLLITIVLDSPTFAQINVTISYSYGVQTSVTIPDQNQLNQVIDAFNLGNTAATFVETDQWENCYWDGQDCQCSGGTQQGEFSINITSISGNVIYFSPSVEFKQDVGGSCDFTHQYSYYMLKPTGPPPPAPEPSYQPTNLAFTGSTRTSISMQWNASQGGAAGYFIVRSLGGGAPSGPTDGQTYVVGNNYITSSNTIAAYVTGTTFTDVGLNPGTTYMYYIWAYNGSGATINYKSLSPLSSGYTTQPPLATEPSNSAINLTFSYPASNGLQLNWQANLAQGQLVIRKAGSYPSFVPVDEQTYSDGQQVSPGEYVVFVGGGPTFFFDDGLNPTTEYYYRIYQYNGSGTGINYRQTAPLEGHRTTLALEPGNQQSQIQATISYNYGAQTSAIISDPVQLTYVVGAFNIGNTVGTIVEIDELENCYWDGQDCQCSGGTQQGEFPINITSISGNTISFSPAVDFKQDVGGSCDPTHQYSYHLLKQQPSSFAFTGSTRTTIGMQWPSFSGASGYLVIRHWGGGPAPTGPVDGQIYTQGYEFSSNMKVAYIGPNLGFTDGDLQPGTPYWYYVYPYNGTGAATNYRIVSPLQGALTTQPPLATEPSNSAINLTFSYPASNGLQLNWQANLAQGQLVIRKAGSYPSFVPVDEQTYSDGQQVSPGEYVVFVGGGPTFFFDDGLNPTTEYYYRIYQYNGSGTGINYRQTAPLEGHRTTLALEPGNQPYNIRVTPLNQVSLNIRWISAPGGADGYFAIRSSGGPIPAGPQDGGEYELGDQIVYSNHIVAYIGLSGSDGINGFTDQGLQPGTTYTYYIYSFNGNGLSANFKTAAALSGSATTRSSITDYNYILSQNILVPNVIESQVGSLPDEQISQTIAYADYMSRAIQTILIKGSPAKKDVVVPYEYDPIGQKTKNYLPFTTSDQLGQLKADVFQKHQQFYQLQVDVAHSEYPYEEIVLEKSPLNRIVETGGAGESWRIGSEHTTKTRYLTNGPNEVRLWEAGNLTSSGFYPPGMLQATETTDEQGNRIVTYTDLSGLTLLKRSLRTDGSDLTSTYYVYDRYNNLTYIIPPELSKSIPSSGPWTVSEDLKSKWVTEFEYDGENRLVRKKIPEADPIYSVYDRLGRVVLTQDGLLRAQGKWMFTKYDVDGRPILTGLYSNTADRATMQAAVDGFVNNVDRFFYERRQANTEFGYSSQAFPIDNMDVWTVTFYDDYDYDNDGSPNVTYSNDSEYLPASWDGNKPFYMLRGKVTGTRTRVFAEQAPAGGSGNGPHLENGDIIIDGEYETPTGTEMTFDPQNPGLIGGGLSSWLTSSVFYDSYGRVIQARSTNSLGGTDLTWTEYDFPGKVLKTKTLHATAAGTITVKKRFEYDHAGRLLKTYQQNIQGTTAGNEILLAQQRYNELGTLIEKKLHSTNGGTSALQTVNYAYNIRGWLTSVNDPNNLGSDLFGFQLNYDQVNSSIGGQARYDGSITQQIWATSANGKHAYGYSYDEMNQLLSAEYEKYTSGWNNDPGKYNESATYDLNGNIKTLNRYAGTMVDNLTFTLDGNRLLGSDDALANTTMALDFEDRGSTYSASNVEYEYDVNGNLIEDKNKKIKVRYNFMNLPVSVVFNNSGDSINWFYAASGQKLQKVVYDDGVVIKTLDYVSGFDYTNGALDFFYCEQGRVKKLADGSLRHEYNLTDHLGNSRVFFTDANNDGTPEVIQESHYYAFGLRIEGLGVQNDNKYLYNGKELTDDFGLNWYEYGWRMYDAEIGRWHQVDPMDEFMSPYCFVGNNPIMLVDPDGAQVGRIDQGDGYTIQQVEAGYAVLIPNDLKVENLVSMLFSPSPPHMNILPVQTALSQSFGNKDEWYYSGMHPGFDQRGSRAIDGSPISQDTPIPVVSVASGVVSEVGYMKDSRGYYVIVKYPNGLEGHYYHLAENSTFVKVRQIVLQGESLGLMGSTGKSDARHLHFGVYQDGVIIDPTHLVPAYKNLPGYIYHYVKPGVYGRDGHYFKWGEYRE